jgi:hypothetical protein
MSKYCPACKSEFHDGIKICPSDNENLVDHLDDDDLLVDIYLAKDEIEAERIISYLRSEGINCQESDTGISQLPAAGDKGFVILVAKSQRAEAKVFLEEARRDQVISSSGTFL